MTLIKKTYDVSLIDSHEPRTKLYPNKTIITFNDHFFPAIKPIKIIKIQIACKIYTTPIMGKSIILETPTLRDPMPPINKKNPKKVIIPGFSLALLFIFDKQC